MQIDTDIIAALIGGCSAAVIGGLTTILSNRITRQSEERRHFRELGVKTALENWKNSIEMAKIRGALTRESQSILPLDVYIIHMLTLIELVGDRRITPENVQEELSKIQNVTNAAASAIKARAQ